MFNRSGGMFTIGGFCYQGFKIIFCMIIKIKKDPILVSVGGISWLLIHLPLTNKKKLSPGFTEESKLPSVINFWVSFFSVEEELQEQIKINRAETAKAPKPNFFMFG